MLVLLLYSLCIISHMYSTVYDSFFFLSMNYFLGRKAFQLCAPVLSCVCIFLLRFRVLLFRCHLCLSLCANHILELVILGETVSWLCFIIVC